MVAAQRLSSITDFLAESVPFDRMLQKKLWQWVEYSKIQASIAPIAAYAITLLNRAGVVWRNKNLSGIRIPGANLRGAVLSGTDLSHADLSGVCLVDAWLAEANLTQANLAGTGWQLDRSIKLPDSILACTYSPDGTWLAVGSGNTIYLYKTLTQQLIRTLNGHNRGIFALAFSPDNRQLASGSEDKTVRLWEVESGRELRLLKGHTNSVLALSYRSDGRQLASGSGDNTVRLWEVDSGRELRLLKGAYGCGLGSQLPPRWTTTCFGKWG